MLMAARPKPRVRFMIFGAVLFANLAVSKAPIRVKTMHMARME